jgi:hypothetical protein
MAAKVEINKQTKRQYQRKKFSLPDGEVIDLKCEHRIRYCSKEQLAQDFMESVLFKELSGLGQSIGLKKAQECICACIKEVSHSETATAC